MQRQLRGILDAPALSASCDVLWLPAVFRCNNDGLHLPHVPGWPAPYPFISAPVLLGTVGGVLMMVGTIGLLAMKFVDDPMPNVAAPARGATSRC